MPKVKLLGRRRKISTGEIIGTTQLKRKVTRKVGFSPWTGKVSQRPRLSSQTAKPVKRRGCGRRTLILLLIAGGALLLLRWHIMRAG